MDLSLAEMLEIGSFRLSGRQEEGGREAGLLWDRTGTQARTFVALERDEGNTVMLCRKYHPETGMSLGRRCCQDGASLETRAGVWGM